MSKINKVNISFETVNLLDEKLQNHWGGSVQWK